MDYYANNNPQDIKMIPMPKHVTLEEELEKQKEYYQQTIKEESPAQKEREEREREREKRLTKILDEYLNIKVPKKKIDDEISSKKMEIFNLKLTNEAEISVKEEKLKELKKLESTRNVLDNKMKILANELILLKKEAEAEKEAAAAEEAAEAEAAAAYARAAEEEAAEEYPRGGKRKSKSKSKKVVKKPVVPSLNP